MVAKDARANPKGMWQDARSVHKQHKGQSALIYTAVMFPENPWRKKLGIYLFEFNNTRNISCQQRLLFQWRSMVCSENSEKSDAEELMTFTLP